MSQFLLEVIGFRKENPIGKPKRGGVCWGERLGKSPGGSDTWAAQGNALADKWGYVCYWPDSRTLASPQPAKVNTSESQREGDLYPTCPQDHAA